MSNLPNMFPPPEAKRAADHVRSLLAVICLMCGALAIYYYRDTMALRGQIEKMRRGPDMKQDGGVPGSQSGKTSRGSESDRVFELLNALAQKDKAMSELRQRLVAIQGGRTPDAGLSTNTLPKSVRLTHDRRSSRPPPKSPPSGTSSSGRAVPLFPNLAEQDTFLRSLDVSAMPAEDQKIHEALLRHMLALRSLMLMQARSEDESGGAWQSAVLREAQSIERLMPSTRRSLLSSIGRELGYDNESSRWFAEYVDYLGRMTTLSPPPETGPVEVPTSAEGAGQ